MMTKWALAWLRRKLGIVSPSEVITGAFERGVREGIDEGMRTAEERERIRGRPPTLEEFIEEQRPFVERLRPIRNAMFLGYDEHDDDAEEKDDDGRSKED